jgi:lipopolysaccharide export LptBFGC system permease protein LptF
LRHKGKGILILLLLSLITIIVGYYLLLSLSPDATLEEAVRRAWAGTILTLIGGILVIIYIFRRSK